ncbi:acetyltransferase [Winogradskyella flava]|uniref:Acetyltransferase n=1 Tax=Winogradskyella flava TaxID=1884876 RepID=A0A842IT62_9FLAO|nr:acetyltransferase [Winogradskyella flava]MBC2845339.1 acetyltransferase [Winogradskyella flava]
MKNILIYGASGHSKMIVDILHKKNDYRIVGFADCYKSTNDSICGYKILGDFNALKEIINKYNVDGIIICIGDNYTRQNLYNNIIKVAPNVEFISAVHPSAIIAEHINIPEGTVIMAGVIVNANSKIGRFCILNTRSSLGHDSEMHDFSSIASNVTIGGNVKIGHCSAICLSTTVIQNIVIGDNTVVGAASLVLKSIDNNKLAYGNPINTIKERKPDSQYLG